MPHEKRIKEQARRMARLVLYSDQIAGLSDALDEALLSFLEGTSHRIAFVPAATDRNNRYFRKACDHYAQLGIPAPLLCDVDAAFDAATLEHALAGDAIHLGGGDTAPFLAALKRNGVLPKLRAFSERGGVLVGISAGAQSIALCAWLDAPSKNKAGTGAKTEHALGLVPFDFSPHDEGDAREHEKLVAFVAKSRRRLIACHDSEGVVLDGSELRLVGDPLVIDPMGNGTQGINR
jgi:dipeptidase E